MMRRRPKGHDRLRTLWGAALSLVRVCAAACTLMAGVEPPALADEIRPAYLELREMRPGEFDVLWQTPMLGDLRLALQPEFSGDATPSSPVATQAASGSAIETWTLRAPALRGQTLRIRGLEATVTDVLTRIQFLDGTVAINVLQPSAPTLVVPERQSALALARNYILYGIQHIWFGIDHLLFVLGLLLIVGDRWTLVKTITSFTLAHSITLAVATLGFAQAPVEPLNAAIALSILFLGPEIARIWRGESSLTIRRPWLVAFIFGLLHGFGFAGALTGAGLPRPDLAIALLTFNIGVEIGQIGFVLLVVLLERSFRQLEISWPPFLARAPGYLIGSAGAFWTIQRTAILLGVVQ
ncbi:MAG TPA: HupE/UreJ family protein [Xanthobacteraceae bacterium]|nr:HupE/UreJ family protein [Xanthobacteraceae bacterium]